MTKPKNLFVVLVNMGIFQMTLKFSLFITSYAVKFVRPIMCTDS